MAINKTAINIKVYVNQEYNSNVGNKLTKIASKMNIESTNENLSLVSNRKIAIKGYM